jgi:hypothetical protein
MPGWLDDSGAAKTKCGSTTDIGLRRKVKELIAIGVAHTNQNPYCIEPLKFRLLSPLLGDHDRGQIILMAQREKSLKKPSYRVYKRKKEGDMRVIMGYETSIP